MYRKLRLYRVDHRREVRVLAGERAFGLPVSVSQNVFEKRLRHPLLHAEDIVDQDVGSARGKNDDREKKGKLPGHPTVECSHQPLQRRVQGGRLLLVEFLPRFGLKQRRALRGGAVAVEFRLSLDSRFY